MQDGIKAFGGSLQLYSDQTPPNKLISPVALVNPTSQVPLHTTPPVDVYFPQSLDVLFKKAFAFLSLIQDPLLVWAMAWGLCLVISFCIIKKLNYDARIRRCSPSSIVPQLLSQKLWDRHASHTDGAMHHQEQFSLYTFVYCILKYHCEQSCFPQLLLSKSCGRKHHKSCFVF